jgi:competence protein ComGC
VVILVNIVVPFVLLVLLASLINYFSVMKKKSKNKKAFTLMETVVILFVLSVGLLSLMSLVRKSLYFQSVKKNLVVASYLSQEGIELMKNIRDTNIILDLDYDLWDGISSAGVGEYTYKVDYYSLIATSCPSIDQAILQNDGGFFRHLDGGEDTIFKRLITVRAETLASTTVESWVSWTDRGQNYDYKLETVLYDLSN